MHKDQCEELQRLEDALLEPEEWEEDEEEALDDPEQWLEEFYDRPPVQCDVYNTDDTDVDLEDFSEAVHQGRRSNGCLVPVIVFLTAVLCLLVGWLLWKLGVIPWA